MSYVSHTGSFGYAIAATGEAHRLAPTAEKTSGCVLFWRHIDGNDTACRKWLLDDSGLPAAVTNALQEIETRPCATKVGDGTLVNLRGVNQNPDADPEDLVSIRLWVTANEVISMNFRPLLALGDMQDIVASGQVRDAGDFVVELAIVLIRRLNDTLDDLSRSLDMLEDDIVDHRRRDIRARIADVRRTAIGLRRYISPQREALLQLTNGPYPFFDESDRQHLAEAANAVTRMIEEIDQVRDQAAVLSDQLSDIRSEAVGKRTLVLSIVSAVFLPLTYITGLVGMNVQGIPFADRDWAFAGVVAVNLSLAVCVLFYLRRRGWFR